MIEDLDGVINIGNDLLVWGEIVQEHDDRLRKLLKMSNQNFTYQIYWSHRNSRRTKT